MTAVVVVTSVVVDASLAADPDTAHPRHVRVGSRRRATAGDGRLAPRGGPVAAAFRSLPAAQRSHAVILTANYGEAGAVDRYRARFGLPEAYSGLNAFGLWGPPPATARPVVLVWEDPRPPTYLRGMSKRAPRRRASAERGARLRPHLRVRRTTRYVGVNLAARGTPVELTHNASTRAGAAAVSGQCVRHCSASRRALPEHGPRGARS